MGLFSRFTRVAKAKANKVAEKLENSDPAAIAAQELTEAREKLTDYQSAVRKMGAQKDTLEKQVAAKKAEIKKWTKDTDTAIAASNDKLAGACIEKQVAAEGVLASLQTQLKQNISIYDTNEKRYLDQKKDIADKESQMDSAKARQEAAKATIEMTKMSSKHVGGSSLGSVENFLGKVDSLESEATASIDLEQAEKGEDIEAQLEELRTDSVVGDRLAAAKARAAKD